MSRSYKKHPFAGDRKNQYMKRLSNKRIRQELKDLDTEYQYNNFKKSTCSQEICDYFCRYTFKQWQEFAIEYWIRFDEELNKPFPDKKRIPKMAEML